MQPIETHYNRYNASSRLQGVGQCSPLKQQECFEGSDMKFTGSRAMQPIETNRALCSIVVRTFTGSRAMQPIETSATCSRRNLKVFRF